MLPTNRQVWVTVLKEDCDEEEEEEEELEAVEGTGLQMYSFFCAGACVRCVPVAACFDAPLYAAVRNTPEKRLANTRDGVGFANQIAQNCNLP